MAAVAVASMEADTGEQTELSLLERRLAGGLPAVLLFGSRRSRHYTWGSDQLAILQDRR